MFQFDTWKCACHRRVRATLKRDGGFVILKSETLSHTLSCNCPCIRLRSIDLYFRSIKIIVNIYSALISIVSARHTNTNETENEAEEIR